MFCASFAESCWPGTLHLSQIIYAFKNYLHDQVLSYLPPWSWGAFHEFREAGASNLSAITSLQVCSYTLTVSLKNCTTENRNTRVLKAENTILYGNSMLSSNDNYLVLIIYNYFLS